MPKYYERQNLNDFFDRMIEAFEACPDKYDAAVSIKGASYSIPAADVRPVVSGEWIDTGSGQECSVCSEFQPGYDNYRNFCPNCGADMRESNNGK